MVGLATVFLIAGLAGCSAAGDGPDPIVPPEPPCENAFWPEPGYEDELQQAVDMWSAALDRDICIHNSGTPVVWEPQIYVKSKNYEGYACGDANINYSPDRLFESVNYIVIAYEQSGCSSEHTILHELGHALARRGLDDTQHVTRPRSVMHAVSNTSAKIDQLSIDFVCERSGC